jgi:hypothetical protein
LVSTGRGFSLTAEVTTSVRRRARRPCTTGTEVSANGEDVMQRWLPLATAVVGGLVLGGCFESTPDISSFQTNLGRAISSRTGGDMTLVSVAKIDGSADDLQHYTVFYNAVVQLNKDVVWCTFFATRDLGTKEPGCRDGRKGDRVTISTIVRFEKRESGWALMCTAGYKTPRTDECFF